MLQTIRFSSRRTIGVAAGVPSEADATASDGSIALWMLVMGFVVSAVVGFFALKILLKLLQRGKLQWFSWYLYCVGVLVLLYWAYCNWFRR